MELIAVRGAAVLFYIQLERTNPLRKATKRELTQKLVERYGFLKFPQSYEDFNDGDKGTTFADGSFGGVEVDELKLFSNGILVGTGESTDVAERLFEDMGNAWREIGLTLTPEMVTKKVYISQLAVHSDIDILATNPGLSGVIENWFPGHQSGIGTLGIYTLANVEGPAAVRIERLVGAPVESLQFFSQAPLPTVLHVSFLTRWETVLKQTTSSSEPEPQS